MRQFIFINLSILLMSTIAIAQQSEGEKEILNITRQWWSAWEKDDLELLENLVDTQFTEYIAGPKRTYGKEAFLEMAKKAFPKLDLLEWEIKDPLIKIHENTAICHYFFDERYIQDDKQKLGSGSFTFVFQRKNGQWKAIASHGTFFENTHKELDMKNSVIEIIRYDLPTEKIEGFESSYQIAAKYLEKTPHCYSYTMIHSLENPSLFIVQIEWDSVEGHTKGFRNSEHLDDFLSHLRPYLEHIVEMNHYNKTPVVWSR